METHVGLRLASRESDEAVGADRAVAQHATVPSESEMRDEAMGAVKYSQ